MFFFFFETESPRVAADVDESYTKEWAALDAQFDSALAAEFERKIRQSVKPVQRVVKPRNGQPRTEVEYNIYGTTRWHGLNPEVQRVLNEIVSQERGIPKPTFNVIAYNCRCRLAECDMYDLLVQFIDGLYQWVILDVYRQADRHKNHVDVHPASSVLLEKSSFRSKEDRLTFAEAVGSK